MCLMASKRKVGYHSGGFTRQLERCRPFGRVLSGVRQTAASGMVSETRGRGCIWVWDMADAVSVGGLEQGKARDGMDVVDMKLREKQGPVVGGRWLGNDDNDLFVCEKQVSPPREGEKSG